MTTRTSPLEQAATWLLDPDGDIYGDERERLRWYEGIAMAASVQWIVVPWTVAVAIWVGGRPVAGVLLAVSLAFYAPIFVVTAYVGRRKVRTVPERWSRKRIVVTVLSTAPYLLATAGFVVAFDLPEEVTVGAAVGGVLGGIAGVAALVVAGSRERAREREADPMDDPEGTDDVPGAA